MMLLENVHTCIDISGYLTFLKSLRVLFIMEHMEKNTRNIQKYLNNASLPVLYSLRYVGLG